MRQSICAHCGFAAGVHALRCSEFEAMWSGDQFPAQTTPKPAGAPRQDRRREADIDKLQALFG